MKKMLFHAGLMLVACSHLFAGEPVKPVTSDNFSVNAGYISAIVVTASEWTNLTSAYQSQNENSTWGGTLNKTDLETLLNSLPETTKLVYFRFVTDDKYKQTGVEFSGGRDNESVPCIRNGGSENAFCPTACNLRTTTCPKAVQLSFQNYKELSAAYAVNNPESTLGGNIDKSALLAIIKSLPAGTTTIHFRFCTDPTFHQTSIIFMGGTVEQPGQKILYLRNGMAASFCPTNCASD